VDPRGVCVLRLATFALGPLRSGSRRLGLHLSNLP
jgi:hypothetical protein